MHETNHWMHSAGERTIRAMLMTAESLASSNEPLDADDTEHLHWCWETVHYIMAARLAQAQIEALTAAADKQPTAADLAQMLAEVKTMLAEQSATAEATAK